MTKIEPVASIVPCYTPNGKRVALNTRHQGLPIGTVLYTEAQMRQLGEACAAVCEGLVTYPPGHGGQWEGYGPVTTHRNGSECAEEIRTLVKEMLP